MPSRTVKSLACDKMSWQVELNDSHTDSKSRLKVCQLMHSLTKLCHARQWQQQSTRWSLSMWKYVVIDEVWQVNSNSDDSSFNKMKTPQHASKAILRKH